MTSRSTPAPGMATGTSMPPPETAFEHQARPHLTPLYQTAYRLTGSTADAEDLLQELLLKLFRRFDQWREIDNPRPWMLRVLYNLHVDLYRKRARTHGTNARTVDSESYPVEEIEHPAPSPALQAERDQRQDRILNALGELGPEQRALVTLHLIEGHTLEEVASILEIPLGTLKSRLHRCKAQLRRTLEVEPFSRNVRLTG